MITNLNKNLKIISRAAAAALLLMVLFPGKVRAWTSARAASVEVLVEVARSGFSTVTTSARFEVEGGEFHGFDLADMPGMALVAESCKAVRDDGREHALRFEKPERGRTRVALDGKEGLKQGALTFHLVHHIDLAAAGALRRYEGRARLNWTPIIWDQGLDVMRVRLVLPGESRDAPVHVDAEVARDYEVDISAGGALLTKYRPVRWYPMQVVADFDPALVVGIEEARPVETRPVEVAAAPIAAPRPPLHLALLPAAIALAGLALGLFKRLRIARLFRDLGLDARYLLLSSTPMAGRAAISVAAAALGLAAQQLGSLAAGVPALAAASAVWITRRDQRSVRPRPGGSWRRMDDEDVARLRRVAGLYRDARRSCLDITSARGALLYLCVLAGLGSTALALHPEWPKIGWAALLDGLLLTVPVWFSSVRAELPLDATLEGFCTLRRWRRALSRLAGTLRAGAGSCFWVREDAEGPVEVRLRVEPPPTGLKGIEVAGEVLLVGTTYRTRPAVILRAEPGTEAARRLASCPHAAEHHLTPDLEEEIIVLRDRRGRSAGLAPLRTALAVLTASSG